MSELHPALGPLRIAGLPLPTREELAWLGGFVDGEGTISLGTNKRSIHPYVSVVNTNLDSFGRARVLCSALVGHDLRPDIAIPRPGSRPAFYVSVHGHLDVAIVVRALIPHLVGKYPQASLVLRFLEIAPGSGSNVAQFTRARGRPPKHGARYDHRHFDMVAEMRRLNRRYAPGEWSAQDDAEQMTRAWTEAWTAKDSADFIGDDDAALKALYKLRIG